MSENVTAQRRHDLADALHDALCNECGAGTGFDFRSADTDKVFAKLIPLLQRWQAEDLAAEREKTRAPFLTLAEELEAWATENDNMEPTNTDGLLRSITAGRVTRRIAQDIRRAAEEGQQ